MPLFNRNYDRDYGYRGTTRSGYGRDFGGRGYDRDRGERGGTWENLKRNTREFFGMDDRYDRGYRYDRDVNTTYNRGYTGRSRLGADYGRDYTAGRGSRYDRPYWGYDTWDYDAEYKSRHQTDTGDPFGDRQSRTPIRVVDEERDRGWFGRNRDYDRGYRGRSLGGYGNDYRSSNAMGYDPYETRGGDQPRWNRSRRGYDRDWF